MICSLLKKQPMNDMNIHVPLTEKQLADEMRLIKTGSCHMNINGMLMRLNRNTVVADPDRENEFMAITVESAPDTPRL